MRIQKFLAAAVLTLAVGVSLVAAQDATPEVTPVPGSNMITGGVDGELKTLNGAGATFPAPLYTAWFADYATLTGVQINYQAIGSGGGIRGVTDGSVDFGASDAPMSDDQLTAAQQTCGGNVLHIATTL